MTDSLPNDLPVFSAKHSPASISWSDRLPPDADAVIIGGGFSGLMCLAHLADRSPEARIVLLERRSTRTPGVAYGGCDPWHLLNVPADRMGATTADVGGFHAWLERAMPGRFKAGDFAPRQLYGRYLLSIVAAGVESRWKRVCFVRDAAVHLDHSLDGMEVVTASGRTCTSSCVVLAPGIPPARAPWSLVSKGAPRSLLVVDPWDAGALVGVPTDGEVLIVGSGLTAIDVVLSIRERGHRGRITLASRNGKLPLPHATPGEGGHVFSEEELNGGPSSVLAAIRRAARHRVRSGLGWQGAIDGVRPFTARIWAGWSNADRQQFLRHARSAWEVHRHRVPRTVSAQLAELQSAKTLQLVRGRLSDLTGTDNGLVRASLECAGGEVRHLAVARVFNCIGPTTSVRHTSDPLLRSALASGMACGDTAGLGLLTDPDGRVLSTEGVADSRLFLVGALRRADAWESTAVPELRVQCEQVAARVAEFLHASGGGIVSRVRQLHAAAESASEGCG